MFIITVLGQDDLWGPVPSRLNVNRKSALAPLLFIGGRCVVVGVTGVVLLIYLGLRLKLFNPRNCSRKSEVAYLDLAVRVDEDVLRFDVSVHEIG